METIYKLKLVDDYEELDFIEYVYDVHSGETTDTIWSAHEFKTLQEVSAYIYGRNTHYELITIVR